MGALFSIMFGAWQRGRRRSASRDTPQSCLSSVNDVSLSQNTLDVKRHGCLRDLEVPGDYLVGLTVDQASEDLDLSA
jgi:hypothetical protein